MRSVAVALALSTCLWAQSKQPFTVDALLKISRISEPQLSPDGKTVAFTVQTIDVPANTRPQHIWTVPAAGGTPMRLTQDGTRNTRPRWTGDGRIAFVSNRSGSSQIWTMNADGSSPRQITALATEAADVLVSPAGRHIAFTSEVYPQCGADDACNKKKIDAEKENKVQARVYTSLLYRHWNAWHGARRKHILIASIDGGPARDLTPGNFDVPAFSLGGPDDFAISPDGSELAYVANNDPDQALSTNTEVYVVPVAGGEPKKVSTAPGSDRSPAYSPDGKYLAFRSQMRAGYESDRWRLIVVDRANFRPADLTEHLDQPVESFTWSPDSTRVFFTTEDRGRGQLHVVPVTGGGSRAVITGKAHVDDVQFTADGKTMIYTEQSSARPVEIYRASSGGGAPVGLTRLNDDLLAQYQIAPAEEFWVAASDNVRVHSFIVKPANFNPSRKYSALLLVHGGPQSAWGETWHYRWNAQVFAGAGFVVVMPNPRGSLGYGQKFTDDINQDWGGKPFEDLMDVTDYVANLPYVDAERMAAGGGSYGGYMVNWILGHTNRFKALVSHAGLFDLASSNLETEELWFPVWEFRGMPWQNPEVYARLSPSAHVRDFKTPTLVMHGELDYRVPAGQALQLFTALQLQKVPSKLVLFPDEGHWILKPQNTMLWYKTFIDWIGEWTMKKPHAGTGI